MTSVWPSIVLRCAQLTFAALIVAVLAGAVSFARLPSPDLALPVRETSALSGARPPLESFAVIAQRNIFRRKGPPVAISGTLPRTGLDLELVATLVAGEGRKWFSLALVKDARDQVVAVREGQSFVGGRVRLVSIEPRRIVIENGGLLEVLSLGSEREEQKAISQGLAAHANEAHPGEAPASSGAYDTRVLESLHPNARTPPR